MNTFSGKSKIGFMAVLAVLLMPLLGLGVANAMEVGDQVTLGVPDLQQFLSTEGIEQRSFTCRAITENAIWLVQDSSWVSYYGSNKYLEGGRREDPKIVWGTDDTLNMVKPEEFTALTEVFEDSVWTTVTNICGEPTDVNGDGKVYVVLAAMPTIWSPMNSDDSRAVRGKMWDANPEFYEIDGVEAEVFHVNIHPFSTNASWATKREMLRKWNLADGLAALCVLSHQPDEETWLVNGIAALNQFETFGLTYVKFTQTRRGLSGMLWALGKEPYYPITNAIACNGAQDFQGGRGQTFMFMMYLQQILGETSVSSIITDSERAGMLSVAYEMDNSATEDNFTDIVTPIFNDFQLAITRSDLHSTMEDGKYQFDFLVGTDDDDWSIGTYTGNAGMSPMFGKNDTPYPIHDWATAPAAPMRDRVFTSQFIGFKSYVDIESPTMYLNAQYTTGIGSNAALLSTWSAWLMTCDDDAGEILSIEELVFDENYNVSFDVDGTTSFVVITNGVESCPPNLLYYVTQNTEVANVENAIHQNSIATQFLTFYTTLFSEMYDDYALFDWYGPIFTATIGDSVLNIPMSEFTDDIFTAEFSAWAAGNYLLEIGGYTPAGFTIESSVDVAVGFADTDLTLEITDARLDVQKGGSASGSMVTLFESGALDISMENSCNITAARGQMTGVLAGPVRISNVDGTLGFNSATNNASVYRYTTDGWVEMTSYRQNGMTSASVSEGGIYALGEGIGAFAPELPAQVVLAANSPNPFAAQTAISFGLPTSGNVVVNVFDMTGRLVNTLANQEMAAASHTIVWDGTDVSGNQVGAGVYFCRLETAGQVLTQKMLKVQ